MLTVASVVYGLNFLFLVRRSGARGFPSRPRLADALPRFLLFASRQSRPAGNTPTPPSAHTHTSPTTNPQNHNQKTKQDPNPDDPLNKEAAQRLRADARAFEQLVQRSITHGASVDGHYFPPREN